VLNSENGSAISDKFLAWYIDAAKFPQDLLIKHASSMFDPTDYAGAADGRRNFAVLHTLAFTG
jgi:hypothetical protein